MTIDIICAVLAFFYIVLGYNSGFTTKIFTAIAFILAFFLAKPLGTAIFKVLNPSNTTSSTLYNVIGYCTAAALIFTVVLLTGSFIKRKFITEFKPLNATDHVLGAVLATLEVTIIAYILLSIAVYAEKPIREFYPQSKSHYETSYALNFVKRHNLFDTINISSIANLKTTLPLLQKTLININKTENTNTINPPSPDNAQTLKIQNADDLPKIGLPQLNENEKLHFNNLMKFDDFASLANDPIAIDNAKNERFEQLLTDQRVIRLLSNEKFIQTLEKTPWIK